MIQHVTRDILASELERSRAFYSLLGYEPAPAPPSLAGRSVWLERAGTQIHLMLIDDRAGADRPPPGHVGLVVDDYPGTVDRLTEAGYTVEPRREHWGSPRSYVRDPAGYLVELMAWAPGQRPPAAEQGSPGREAGE